MSIKVTVRSVYGVDKWYPACERAKLFAELAGTATLTDETLMTIAALGYDLELVTE